MRQVTKSPQALQPTPAPDGLPASGGTMGGGGSMRLDAQRLLWPVLRTHLPAPSPPIVEVVMSDYRFEHKPVFPQGRVVIRAANAGRVDHELTMVALPEGFPPSRSSFEVRADDLWPSSPSCRARRQEPPAPSLSISVPVATPSPATWRIPTASSTSPRA